jgi:DNA-binding GntR family transcriptional regulator
MSDRGKTAIKVAAERLRAMSLAADVGVLLGSEDAMVARLGFSRSTVRQVARLLEREGLLKVRKGPNGGYFAARPDAETIQSTVSAYLETLEMDRKDVTAIASALWVEVVRKAAGNASDEARAVVEGFRKRVASLKPDASFDQVRKLDLESRKAIFDLTNSRYIELIFDINMAFATRTFPLPEETETSEHMHFVRTWRDAKVMELAAIAEQDVELAAMAARYVRKVWHDRIWARRRKDPTQ